MNPQFDNLLMSSFLLYIDNIILSRGQAYQNYSSQLYPTNSYIQGQYCYSAPYKQLVNDISISGANVMSGVYINGNYVSIGMSGLTAINHYQGAVYFSNPLSPNTIVSGNYSIKDFSIELTNQPEWKLLTKTKFLTSDEYYQNPTGLDLDTKITPIIFLRTKLDNPVPFALGGIENHKKIIRAIVIADNEFQRAAVCNILYNRMYSPFYITTGIPFDAIGNMTGINYNYNSLQQSSGYFPWIMNVKVVDVPRDGNFEELPQNMSFVDINIQTLMQHNY